MAMGLLESGPKFDWTRDNKIFDRFQIWKEKVEMIFSSALLENTPEQKVAYLRYWMGDQGIPLVTKWTALDKLDFSNPTDRGRDRPISSGFILDNYWKLLEAEFKPKGNKLLSVIELWTRSRQGSKTLNEWLTYVYNLVESCDYGDSNDRIISDVLIIGCNSDKAKDKIVRQGEKIKLQEVIKILQLEDSTRQTLTEMNSTVQKINYVSYEKKKSKGNKNKQKIQNNSNCSNSSSSGQKQASTGPGKQCYQCKKPFTKGHEKVCKAINAKCDACGITGHYQIACRKSGNFPQKANSGSNSTGRMNVAAAVGGIPSEADFFDKQGLLKEYQPKVMNVLSGTSSDKPIMIEFGCGLTPLSIDRKLTLQVDTGADANAINKKTFDQLFPEVELEESTFILKNFDKRLIKPVGSFRCFLRWKGHKYRVQIEVMGTDTPYPVQRNYICHGYSQEMLHYRESVHRTKYTKFLHFRYYSQRKNRSVHGRCILPFSSAVVAPAQVLSTEGVFSHSDPSTEAVFCHSDLSTEAVFCHSVPPAKEDSPNPSTETAQMHVASGQNMRNFPVFSDQGSNKQSLSITDLPLTQEKVESTYADVFQGLGKFPDEPYKLRLKPDAVPAKHRPRKVPVHLQEAFHEEVERLVKIDVLEPITEPTEWLIHL